MKSTAGRTDADPETVRRRLPTVPVPHFTHHHHHHQEEEFFGLEVRVELRDGRPQREPVATQGPLPRPNLREPRQTSVLLEVKFQVAPDHSSSRSSRGGEPTHQQRSPGDAHVNDGAMSRRKQGNPQHLSRREITREYARNHRHSLFSCPVIPPLWS